MILFKHHLFASAIIVLLLHSAMLKAAVPLPASTESEGAPNSESVEIAVKLYAFRTGDEVSLWWETEREVNIRQFILQRSYDGILFDLLVIVPAKNRFPLKINYTFNDHEAAILPGASIIYRLITIDMNGSHYISQATIDLNMKPLISER